ncbi:MAG: hypothetical protein ACTSPI_11135 [Candidatus Heimdallarchaeaceae archaeon]
MSERKDVLEYFKGELEKALPTILAIYEFTKKIAKFDKLLKDKRGLVIILRDEDYTLEKLIEIDRVYDKVQDKFGWPEGSNLANSFSRGYIRTLNNLWQIDMMNPRCLLPEDMLNLKETHRLIYGQDVLSETIFPHEE